MKIVCQCGRRHHATDSVPLLACRQCGAVLVGNNAIASRKLSDSPGVGSILRRMLKDRGYTDSLGCGCESKARQMDRWGPDGCREHMEEIVDWLAEAARKAGWLERITIATPGVRNMAHREIRRLVEEAIADATRLS